MTVLRALATPLIIVITQSDLASVTSVFKCKCLPVASLFGCGSVAALESGVKVCLLLDEHEGLSFTGVLHLSGTSVIAKSTSLEADCDS